MSLSLGLSQIRNFRPEARHLRRIFTRSILSSNSSSDQSQLGGKQIGTKLRSTFPDASQIHVEDISGGCGAMYQIYVEDNKFNGLSKVKQHQLVNEALKDEIKSMHGIRISTAVPKPS